MRPAIVTSLLWASLAGCSRDRPTEQAVERSPGTSSLLDPRRDRWLQPDRLLARVGIRRDATVADIGAGAGYFTLRLGAQVPDGHVIATDIEPRLLAITEQRARSAGLANITTRLASRDSPGLEPQSIDVIWMCQVDHLIADRATYFRALARTLRPGGRLAVINESERRDAVVAAAASASLRVVDQWNPSPLYFLLVLEVSP
jgi:ubiquinone/menaquinone biosynthesis C-methylase UbiE